MRVEKGRNKTAKLKFRTRIDTVGESAGWADSTQWRYPSPSRSRNPPAVMKIYSILQCYNSHESLSILNEIDTDIFWGSN